MGQSRWMMMTALTAGMMAVMAVTGWAAQPGMHRAGAVSDTARTEAHGDAQYRPAVIDGNIQPQNLTGAEDADQLIVVVGTGGCNADTYYYKRGMTPGTWSGRKPPLWDAEALPPRRRKEMAGLLRAPMDSPWHLA